MIFFGHLGTTLFLAALLSLNFLFVLIGVLAPDILDKFFYMIVPVFPCGRFIGHTIWFGPAIALATYAITRKKMAAYSVLFGAYVHMLGDIGYLLPLFMPFVTYQFNCTSPFSGPFDPFYFYLEVIGLVLLAITIVYHKKLSLFGSKLLKKFKHI
jgi:hypothetical protein